MVRAMSAVCPVCGVAVVPGYVRCPKCHAGLRASSGRIKRPTAEPGGTAVAAKGFPISAVLVAVGVAAAIILVFGLRGGSPRPQSARAASAAPLEAVRATPQAPPVARAVAPVAAPPSPLDARPDPRVVASELEAGLRKQRLWTRVEVIGTRLDVRSGSCRDPAMRPAIDGKTAVLRGAGLTRLRCVEQSGAVVFEHEL
jgi:hypothetical protein